MLEAEDARHPLAQPPRGVGAALRMHAGVEQGASLGMLDQVGRNGQRHLPVLALDHVLQPTDQPAAGHGVKPRRHRSSLPQASLAQGTAAARPAFSRHATTQDRTRRQLPRRCQILKAITVEPGTANSVRLEERPEPPPDPASLLVQMTVLGVCGTDREIIAGSYGWSPAGNKRLVLGHESLGRVLEAPDTSDFSP